MVLKRCCPRWVSSVLVSPQNFCLTAYSNQLNTLLYYSLVFQSSLSDLFGADYPERDLRTEVNWVYWSYRLNSKLFVKTFASQIESCSDLWPSANWLERELWEMFGVAAEFNDDLRRLITDYGFSGYPLRKDFPVTGYLEVRYSEVARRVVSKPVLFSQEFRLFDFKSPWLN